MPPKIKPSDTRLNRHGNYMREFDVVNVRSEQPEGQPLKMIVAGNPIVFNQPTVLFSYDGVDYKEVIDAQALNNSDISECFMKFNHSDWMVVARVKNGSLKLDIRADGVYFEAEIANTQTGRDLYELVRTKIIDKMSFAFTIDEEEYDELTHTWKVRKIGKLYDVAAVAHPAYEQTDIYARRLGEVESRRAEEVEALALQKKESLAKRRKMIQDLIKK